MSFLLPSTSQQTRHPRCPARLLFALIAMLGLGILTLWIGSLLRHTVRTPRPTPLEESLLSHPPTLGRSTLVDLIPPTPQRRFLEPNWQTGVQPTITGNPESALYGSTRNGANGLPSFHEGLDIAVVSRDHKGRPMDPVVAVADGRIAYINRSAGDSNYGHYIVLLHDDPVGEVYTLYAHLAEITPGLREGNPISRGERLGTVGNTPTALIPLSRAHLHFEIGLVMNRRYEQWAARQKLKNLHGNFNGGNLAGLDPLELFHFFNDIPNATLKDYLTALPPAFSVVVRGRNGMPDFFARYPSLWQGDPPPPRTPIWISFSEGGVPLQGRTAEIQEAVRMGRRTAVVLEVAEPVLGRNGRRLVVRKNGEWTLSSSGEQWLDLLLFE